MILKKWIQKILYKKKNINYWDQATTPLNVVQRFQLLNESYNSLHQNIKAKKATEVTKIEGNYAVSGHNTWDILSKYSGHLKIISLENGKYETHWDLGISGQYQSGNGFFYKNYLSVSFQYQDEENRFTGEVIYHFIDEQKAIGFWIEEGIFEVGYEELNLKNRGF